MASVNAIWIVRDPGKKATLGDICWEQPVAMLADYILGASIAEIGAWQKYHHAIYLDEGEAKTDARARLERVQRPAESERA